jgi:hypothetical protein
MHTSPNLSADQTAGPASPVTTLSDLPASPSPLRRP